MIVKLNFLLIRVNEVDYIHHLNLVQSVGFSSESAGLSAYYEVRRIARWTKEVSGFLEAEQPKYKSFCSAFFILGQRSTAAATSGNIEFVSPGKMPLTT